MSQITLGKQCTVLFDAYFGELKQDMGFRRFLCKGKKNVLAESILLAMAHNINKLHNKIQSNRTKTHLYQLKETA